ncbi:MAG: OmpH family outer membrane protein [Hellea sp.]|nr:OmpH family outer membrane protein [Hellea sp.]
MKLMSKFYRGTIAAIATLVISVGAYAQSTILVLDQKRVIKESTVGQHIESQLDTIAQTMAAELKSSSSTLQSEANTLKSEMEALSAAGTVDFSTRPDLQSRLTTLAGKSQKQQYEAAMKERELAKTEYVAYQKVREQLRGILQQVVLERNADVVIDRSAIIYGKPADITDVVLSRLNSQMTSVQVTREHLPRQAQ